MEDGLLQVNDRGTAMPLVVNHLGIGTKIGKRKGISCSDLCKTVELYRNCMIGNIPRCLAVIQGL